MRWRAETTTDGAGIPALPFWALLVVVDLEIGGVLCKSKRQEEEEPGARSQEGAGRMEWTWDSLTDNWHHRVSKARGMEEWRRGKHLW